MARLSGAENVLIILLEVTLGPDVDSENVGLGGVHTLRDSPSKRRRGEEEQPTVGAQECVDNGNSARCGDDMMGTATSRN